MSGNGYASREALIRGHWKKYGYHWDIDRIGPRLNIPVRHRTSLLAPTQPVPISTSPVINKLEFAFESGRINGQRAYRITCENLVVEEGVL